MPGTDGHFPMWTQIPWGVHDDWTVIGCECGWAPEAPSKRMSMQHVQHGTHRRQLKLQPVNYAWDDAHYRVPGAISTGGLMTVRGAVWKNGRWTPA